MEHVRLAAAQKGNQRRKCERWIRETVQRRSPVVGVAPGVLALSTACLLTSLLFRVSPSAKVGESRATWLCLANKLSAWLPPASAGCT